MNVTVVGCGFVGSRVHKLLKDAAVKVEIWDPDRGFARAAAKACDMAIICVPTPMKDTGECDVSAVENAIETVEASLYVIKSTVSPGTTEDLTTRYGRRIVFSPEYMGESSYYTPPQYPDPNDMAQHGFMIVGGREKDTSDVIDFFLPILGPTCRFRQMSATQAEVVKYAENCFFALKVAFANELREICDGFGVSYHAVREGWLDDPRVGPMHTAAFKDARGFSGKCLPKDLHALAFACRDIGYRSILLEALIDTNEVQHTWTSP